MNLLLTGSNGFLGKIIFEELEAKYKIFGLSRNLGDYQIALDSMVPDFKECFDLVIHSAGKAHTFPKTEAEKKEFFEINVRGTKNLLSGLSNLLTLPKAFVFISSVAVYGCESGHLIDESHALNATDPYGLSKIEAEQLVEQWCKKHGIICTILRLPLLVGKNALGNLGAMVKAIEKGYYFNIGGGDIKKSMVLAEDVAKFIPKIADCGGIYNLTDGINPTFSALSYAIAQKKQLNLPLFLVKIIAFLGDLLGDKAPINSSKLKKITSELTFDDSKAKRYLYWEPHEVLKYINDNSI